MKPFAISLIVAACLAAFYTMLKPVERMPDSLGGQAVVIAAIVVVGLAWSLLTRGKK